ncbi:hypothetical protein GOP47_0007253 [Adiantum capillus-veneris]|uniref:Uncharacterized protein n=1 Tax=Adiantum capillus-veneris TaxID=13818 RepID=A0A9D4V0J6_ADICA|nr:hypothetical protein GOP47_0007253 [Adiantum capillus-veneris]
MLHANNYAVVFRFPVEWSRLLSSTVVHQRPGLLREPRKRKEPFSLAAQVALRAGEMVDRSYRSCKRKELSVLSWSRLRTGLSPSRVAGRKRGAGSAGRGYAVRGCSSCAFKAEGVRQPQFQGL